MKHLWIIAITLLILALAFNDTFALVSQYDFTQSLGTYTELGDEEGTVLTGLTNVDDATMQVNLPTDFNFYYNGVKLTQVSPCTNGWVGMGSTTSTIGTDPIFQQSGLAAVSLVAIFARDMIGYPFTPSTVKWAIQDEAPNRVLVIQYKNWHTNASGANSLLNAQLRLYETSHNIQIVYGSNVNSITHYVQTGLKGSTASDWNLRTALTDWSSSTQATSNADRMQFSPTIMPPSGLTYTWTPMQFNISGATVNRIQSSINYNTRIGNQAIANIVVNVIGVVPPTLDATSFTFNSNGTTNTASVINAKMFYTGSSATYATTTQFGAEITDISAPFTFQAGTTLTLQPGVHNFWLTYELNTNANAEDICVAQCTNILITPSEGEQINVVPNPSSTFRVVRGPLSGIYTVGNTPTADFSNLNMAFADLNLMGMSGNVGLKIVSDIVEPTSAILKQVPTTPAGSAFIVKIYPDGDNRRISGAIVGNGLLVFQGSDNISIDGQFYSGDPFSSAGDGQNHLTISNDITNSNSNQFTLFFTNNTSPTSNGCTNVYVGYCNIAGSNNLTLTSNQVIRVYSTTAINSNFIIEYNNIYRAYQGIYIYGASSKLASNCIVRYNNIGHADLAQSINYNGVYTN
jgi:hypothetical protein